MSTLKVDGIRSNSATSDAITLASDGTCTANITNNLSNRNLIINGAMQVAQRGTSSTTPGDSFQTTDRIGYIRTGLSENTTQEQANVASGTEPYTSGFRKSLKLTNGNNSANAAQYQIIRTRLEAQDIANSGWNYTSSSSNVTFQFWVKCSVAQNFYGYFISLDGTAQTYPFETGSLTADTWTKITKTIPGNSNLQFDNDANAGLEIVLAPYWGTDFTASSVTLNQWAAYSSGTRTPDSTATWQATNDATFETTGWQLEVGSVATDFEHRSFAQELELCKRYFFQIGRDSRNNHTQRLAFPFINEAPSNTGGYIDFRFHPEMRATPTATIGSELELGKPQVDMGSYHVSSFNNMTPCGCYFFQYSGGQTGSTGDSNMYIRVGHVENSYAHFSAEL